MGMTGLFHKAVHQALWFPTRRRVPRVHTLSFTCYRLVADDDSPVPALSAVQVVDPMNAMRALVFTR